MRGKRSKAYKKLMLQYHQVFGFREPYQVLVDSKMVCESVRCTMDLALALERTLRGRVKPMITHCSIRHLYALPLSEFPQKDKIIAAAKTCEKRKCNHHELDEPLLELECFRSVVIKNGQNKHRYCIAAQDGDIKEAMKEVPGVPLIVINRSVMILEPMTEATKARREGMEREKFKMGLIDARSASLGVSSGKRKRDDENAEDSDASDVEEAEKKKKRRGPKGPNPLSVKKRKSRPQQAPHKEEGKEGQQRKRRKRRHGGSSSAPIEQTEP